MRVRRLVLMVGWELLAVALLVAFVLLIATMPPLQVYKQSGAPLGYRVRVDTDKWQQNLHTYAATVRKGTLGRDREGRPVAPMLWSRLGNSMKLLGISLCLAVLLGVAKGVHDFLQIRRARRVALGPLLTGMVQGLPDFWLVMVLQVGAVLLFNRTGLRPFPVAFDDHVPVIGLVYPVFCLSLIPWAYVARMTATAMQTVYDQDFIRTARAKGLREVLVVYRHALAAALVQILDGLPNALAVMFSNLLIVEALFRYPGITILIRDAANPLSRLADPRLPAPPADVPVLVAGGIALGLVFSLLHLTISVLRRLLDPRLKERDAA